MLAGTLPAAWGRSKAFPALQYLALFMPLTGTLPASWGGNTSFQALTELHIGASRQGGCRVTGSLPSLWGSFTAFQALELLEITNCTVSGMGFLARD